MINMTLFSLQYMILHNKDMLLLKKNELEIIYSPAIIAGFSNLFAVLKSFILYNS